MKKLVIVESPAKAKTIGKIVGPDYIVKASVGHVRDLPKHSLGIKISPDDAQFEPVYIVTDDKKTVVADLVRKAKECDAIYLASDPDREGEAIAWHLKEILEAGLKKGTETKFFRVQYNEITPTAVRKAFEDPHDINMPLVDAQQARRVLDRLVGYKVSPSLWQQVGKGLSAGRVQSVGLRLVCEREAEIRAFTPAPYWLFGAKLRKRVDPKSSFSVKLRQIRGVKADVQDEALAKQVHEALACSAFTVADLARQDKIRRPFAPFITSTLQQAASNALGFSPNFTMSLAQKLYEGVELAGDGPVGLITYMRTDSFTIAKDAQEAARAFIEEKYGSDFVSPKQRTYKNKSAAQGAHEAIRPTDPARTPASLAGALRPQELKLYELIWKRFLASQMADARFNITTAKVRAEPANGFGELMLSASAAELVFPGFLKVAGEAVATLPDDDAKEGDDDLLDALPPLAPGESLDLLAVADDRKETKPPARFNEASLVKALEANGIGRPSTYASILATLMARGYVLKERRALLPTELGEKVNAFLVANYNDLFNVGFTAAMETQLDEVEDPEKKLEWQGMLRAFYDKLKLWLAAAKAPVADPDVVEAVLAKFGEVTEWAPPVKRGKRTFSDQQFVEEIGQKFRGELPAKKPAARKGKKAAAAAAEEPVEDVIDVASLEAEADSAPAPAGDISQNQLRALLNILVRYRSSLSDFEGFLKSIGREDILEDEQLQPPRASTLEIFEILDKAGVDEGSTTFYQSLRDQVRRGKRLSPKQRHYLDRMFLGARKNIPDFSRELCERLEVVYSEPVAVDVVKIESILAGLGQVHTWKEPVRKGRRVYDDAEFFKSVAAQFTAKKSLSEPQIKVLERMFLRYREQIPNADDLIARHDIKLPPRKTRASANA
ncbi:MAG: type I DNA topoisomerase [Kiritimatiellae bacterium]|nr:type I DNA topoisomerase [Kiritimatiellia bacterium]